MKLIAASAFAATLAAASAGAGAQALAAERTLTMNAALALASAALERCRADGFQVTINVINRHARTMVVLSDDGVNPHTVENSYRKAYTAFTTRTSTAEMAKRPQPALASFMLLEHVTALEGGLPIYAAKELVGAVGISGAPGGDKDAACAQVGIDKIAKGLTP